MSKYITVEQINNAVALCKDEPFTKASVIAITELLPSADVVEVKHGHWELDGTCSVCGKHTLQSYGNFCCYCGADMRERKETE